MAQWLEPLATDQRVVGSIPGIGDFFSSKYRTNSFYFCKYNFNGTMKFTENLLYNVE